MRAFRKVKNRQVFKNYKQLLKTLKGQGYYNYTDRASKLKRTTDKMTVLYISACIF